MHIWIDESYSTNVYVLAALLIYDRASQKSVTRVVRETQRLFEYCLHYGYPKKFARLQTGRIRELKGATPRDRKSPPGLNDYPGLRNHFFQRVIQDAGVRIYVLYMDLPVMLKRVPKIPDRRYGRYLQTLVAKMKLVPPNAQFVGVTIDSQGCARPTQEHGKLYTWRKRRRWLRRQRINDKARHKRWAQQIDETLRHRYRGHNLHRKVWLVASHLDACLQAVDVIANFARRYENLGVKIAPFKHRPTRNQMKWFRGFEILASHMRWLHNPELLKPKHAAATKDGTVRRDRRAHGS